MLKLMIGSALSQIDSAAAQTMVNSATKYPEDRFFIIVPEQFTLQTQKKVVELHPSHACMNIDVVSFDRLANVVLARMGKETSELLDDVGKALVLRGVLEESVQDLTVYAAKIRQSGFVEEMKSLITEFIQYGIDDNELYLMQTEAEGKSRLLISKLQDIRLIYRKFLEAIADKYITQEELLDVFVKSVPDSDFLKGTHIFLDGFTGFTPVQYRIIEAFLKVSKEVVITLTVPRTGIREDCPEYDLFALAGNNYFRLRSIADQCGCQCDKSFLDDIKNEKLEVSEISAPSIQDEAEFAASRILSLVRNSDCRLRDIAILTSDMDSYYDVIRTTLRSAGIKAFIDHKSEFKGNILVRFIMAALDISSKGMLYEPVFNLLKTGLCGISEDECALLENYCLEFNIKGRSKWESDFSANRELMDGSLAWDLEEINSIRKKIKGPLCIFYGMTSKKNTVSNFVKVLTNLMEKFAVSDSIKALSEQFRDEGDIELALQYEQIYEKVTELLEKTEMLMGGDKISVKEFTDIIESGINEIKIAVIPPSVDMLTVGDITRTRLGNIKYMFVLGANAGKLLTAGSGSALFTQKEREFIKLRHEIAPTVLENIYNQRYYLYLCFNKPDKALYITYANTSAQGEQLMPSDVLEDLDELIVKNKEVKICTYSGSDSENWMEKAENAAAKDIRRAAAGEKIQEPELMKAVAQADPIVLKQLIRAASYSNKQSSLDSRVALDLYGDVLKGSVSRYEAYYACPYRHFLRYGLNLEPRREYKVEATDLGTIYHGALELYSEQLKERGLSFRNVSDDESHSIISESVAQAISSIGNDVLSSSARNEHFKLRIEEIASRTTDVLREQVRAGLFEPDEFEFAFKEKISDSVVFKGKIDRIDIYESGDVFVKIIDYKSGSKKFDIKDIYSGMQLQLVAYMNSAIKAVKEKHPDKNVRPGGVYYYLINDKYVKPEESADKNKMSGITLADENVIHALDSTLGTAQNMSSNIVSVSYNKSGLSSRSNVASENEFENLINFVNGRIVEAGERIREGDISLSPFRQNDSHTGCSFCDFKDICRFEAGCFGTDWREIDADTKDIEEAVYGRNKMD